MANLVSKEAAIKFLKGYQEAYASVTGLRYNIPGKEVLDNYEQIFKDELFVDTIKAIYQLGLEEFKQKYLVPFSKEDDYINYLANQIITHNNIADHQIADVPVGTLPTNDFNAAAIKTDIGDRVIVLNTGTIAFMSEVLNSFLGTLPTQYSAPLWTKQDAIFRIIQWTTAVSTGTAKFGISKTPTFTNPDLMGASGSIGDNARVFMLAHEYGHFIKGHLNDANTKSKLLVPDNKLPAIEFYIKDHEQEFEADLKGCELCIEWCKKTHKNGHQIAFFAIIFTFHLLKLVEIAGTSTDGELTHPPSDSRRKRFEERYFEEFDAQIKYEIGHLDYFMAEVYSYLERLKTNPDY
jgi:hypothetical protein